MKSTVDNYEKNTIYIYIYVRVCLCVDYVQSRWVFSRLHVSSDIDHMVFQVYPAGLILLGEEHIWSLFFYAMLFVMSMDSWVC